MAGKSEKQFFENSKKIFFRKKFKIYFFLKSLKIFFKILNRMQDKFEKNISW